jgi:hypothetical protein
MTGEKGVVGVMHISSRSRHDCAVSDSGTIRIVTVDRELFQFIFFVSQMPRGVKGRKADYQSFKIEFFLI